jgi:recombination protein U
MVKFWTRAEEGGRKSFRREELDSMYRISLRGQVFVHYLEAVQRDLDQREHNI